jgi:hypothetical protein
MFRLLVQNRKNECGGEIAEKTCVSATVLRTPGLRYPGSTPALPRKPGRGRAGVTWRSTPAHPGPTPAQPRPNPGFTPALNFPAAFFQIQINSFLPIH